MSSSYTSNDLDDEEELAALAVITANTMAVIAVAQQRTYGPEEDMRGRNSSVRNNKRRKFDHEGALNCINRDYLGPNPLH
jgi:hypothetical protein